MYVPPTLRESSPSGTIPIRTGTTAVLLPWTSHVATRPSSYSLTLDLRLSARRVPRAGWPREVPRQAGPRQVWDAPVEAEPPGWLSSARARCGPAEAQTAREGEPCSLAWGRAEQERGAQRWPRGAQAPPDTALAIGWHRTASLRLPASRLTHPQRGHGGREGVLLGFWG